MTGELDVTTEARTELDVAAEAVEELYGPNVTRGDAESFLDAIDPRIASLPEGTITACIDTIVVWLDSLDHQDFTSEQREALARLAKEQNT